MKISNKYTPSASFRLFIILTFIMIGRPQDIFPALKPFRLALLFSVLCAAATFLNTPKDILSKIARQKICRKYMFLYAVMIFGVPFAYHRGMAFDFIFFKYSVNILFFWIFCIQVQTWEQLEAVLFVMVIASFMYSAASMSQGRLIGSRLYFGSMFDPNDLAYFLVSFAPVNLIFIVNKKFGKLKRIFCLTSILMAIVIILMTGSRGGFIAIAAIFIMLFWSPLFFRKKSVKILVLLLLVSFLSYNSKLFVTDRLESILELEQDYNVTGEYGRLSLWKRGIGFVLENPLTGVGVNCFPRAIGLQREAEGIVPRWQVVHNAYIQMASEVGVIGFILFLLIIWDSFGAFSASLKKKIIGVEIHEKLVLKKALFISFAGSCIAAFFLTQGYSIFFTTFFALALVVTRVYPTFHTALVKGICIDQTR